MPNFQTGLFTFQPPYTVEFWTKNNHGPDTSSFWVWFRSEQNNISPQFSFGCDVNDGVLASHSSDSGFRLSAGLPINFNGTRQHIVWSVDSMGNVSYYYNGIYFGTEPGQSTPYTPTDFYIDYSVADTKTPMDEFRFYDATLSEAQILSNYNSGIGANPCVTEFLKVWFQFEQFEMLDFSALQDGSDVQLGIKDMSNHHNHGMPINLDTNLMSPTYVLKPF